jgi:hypothetical protein
MRTALTGILKIIIIIEKLKINEMKNILLTSLIITTLIACNSDKKAEQLPPGVHAGIVHEALQTTQYTYLRVKEGDTEHWLAVQKMPAENGETYYYKDGLPMTDFNSKELNRTFKEVFFVDYLSSNPSAPELMSVNSSPEKVENKQEASQSVQEMSMSRGNESSAPSGEVHKIVVKDFQQTKQYTYILAKEADKEIWLAVNKMQPVKDKTYFFKGGLLMKDFESKELNKKFDEVLFVDNISENISSDKNEITTQNNKTVSTGSKIPLEKENVNLKHDRNDITIAMVLENKKSYEGKSIMIKGKVTKYTAGIMKKNWVHLQDGTDYNGKFDLTVTTDQEVNVGDVVSAEGVINLDKDFGYGYYYDVIMEDAKVNR